MESAKSDVKWGGALLNATLLKGMLASTLAMEQSARSSGPPDVTLPLEAFAPYVYPLPER